MSVLIDPYMFELVDEQEIRNNISFFQKIVKLTSVSERDRRLKIVLYKGIVDKINLRNIQPFPIQISKIKDMDLQAVILELNKSFSNILLESIECLDVESCEGDQDFSVDGQEENDGNYFELFSTLLIPCYSHNVLLDDNILTGVKSKGRKIGEVCSLECKCEKCEYRKNCCFIDINSLIPQKELLVERFKELFQNNKIVIVDTVEAMMNKHHNWVQADKKDFKSLDDLSRNNKIVLRLLKELGLYKIIFGRFNSQGGNVIGSLSIKGLKENETQDILTVKFISETQMEIETDLYFPKGVGALLIQYFQNERLIYKNVRELIEKIK